MSVLDNAIQALYKMAHMYLLWENASPESSFGAQSIAINLSEYSKIQVIFNYAYNSAEQYTAVADIGTSGAGNFLYYIAGNGYPGFRQRGFYPESNGVKFDTAYSKRANQTDTTESPNYVIPCKIYGIKRLGGGQ